MDKATEITLTDEERATLAWWGWTGRTEKQFADRALLADGGGG